MVNIKSIQNGIKVEFSLVEHHTKFETRGFTGVPTQDSVNGGFFVCLFVCLFVLFSFVLFCFVLFLFFVFFVVVFLETHIS